MGSSVSFYGIVGLWITFRSKMSTTTTPPKNFALLRDRLWMYLRSFLQCHSLCVVLMQVKTAGYQS